MPKPSLSNAHSAVYTYTHNILCSLSLHTSELSLQCLQCCGLFLQCPLCLTELPQLCQDGVGVGAGPTSQGA